ncbi:hypothetical protein ACIHCV_38635 [Streptomyces sp. NPDC051956]|uniref:hypothetical protein n=1 Tax=Streptomyces sp. NPDC051956 TaxID=3365677 RepID=UPI0037D57F9A
MPQRTPTPHRPAVKMLSDAFHAFYELHQHGYFAYAAAHLSDDEARIAVTHTFSLIAADWPQTVTQPNPAAYAWDLHTHFVTARTGTHNDPQQDTLLLYERLHLTIERIAALTGTEPASVTALLAAAQR